jgi:triosephosphate isomerase
MSSLLVWIPVAVSFRSLATSYQSIHQPSPCGRKPVNFALFSEEFSWFTDSHMGNPMKSVHSSTRTPIIAGNWKLNPASLPEATNLLKLLASDFVNHRGAFDSNNAAFPEVVVFPPFPFLSTALGILEGTGIKVGAQNIGLQTSGAYTGEVSPSMIRSMGCDYIMLGHSERRSLFGESDATINAKVHLCLQEANLGIILCVGETEQEYESNLLESVVDVQIKKALLGVDPTDLDRIVIAYEPIWAIGTGKVATPEQAQLAHVAVRNTLAQLHGEGLASQVRIQYGGSVNPDNVQDLMAMPDIDGALVGGASIAADSFTRIVDGGRLSGSPDPCQFRPTESTARECLTTNNVLGESPVWSDRDQCLYWISAPEEEIWAWNLKDPPYRRLMGTTLGCVVLQAGGPGSVVMGGERAILQLDMSPSTTDFASGPSVLCERPDRASTTRPNDGRVDRQGRLVFGMYNNYHRAGASAGENNAGLFRLDGTTMEYEEILDYRFRVSNCICFTGDGQTMFFCDTPTRKVYAFDYNSQGGKLSDRRLIWTVPPNLPGGPDGAQVDADGCIWIALSGSSRVVRVNPATSQVDHIVHLPVKSPTSCTFGGPDLDELFITTRGPDGGGLYRVKMPFGIRGLPEPEFGAGMQSPSSTNTLGHQPTSNDLSPPNGPTNSIPTSYAPWSGPNHS